MKNQLTELLRPHVGEIKLAAANGDKNAQDIIALYTMHMAAPSDPGAYGICTAIANEWIEKRNEYVAR